MPSANLLPFLELPNHLKLGSVHLTIGFPHLLKTVTLKSARAWLSSKLM